jgi:hypothetical protein
MKQKTMWVTNRGFACDTEAECLALELHFRRKVALAAKLRSSFIPYLQPSEYPDWIVEHYEAIKDVMENTK